MNSFICLLIHEVLKIGNAFRCISIFYSTSTEKHTNNSVAAHKILVKINFGHDHVYAAVRDLWEQFFELWQWIPNTLAGFNYLLAVERLAWRKKMRMSGGILCSPRPVAVRKLTFWKQRQHHAFWSGNQSHGGDRGKYWFWKKRLARAFDAALIFQYCASLRMLSVPQNTRCSQRFLTSPQRRPFSRAPISDGTSILWFSSCEFLISLLKKHDVQIKALQRH